MEPYILKEIQKLIRGQLKELRLGNVKGPKGDDGATGPAGKDGVDGKSAYQAAVEKGYTGTEEEFNAALAGMENAPFLPLSGGTMTGHLDMGGKTITGVSSLYSEDTDISMEVGPVNLITSLTTDGNIPINLNGCRVQGVNGPTSDTDAANKGYVDGKILYGTADPGVGSALATGTLYVVYE